jgi:SPP1 gp7 family putative phage head morphogenesis protein
MLDRKGKRQRWTSARAAESLYNTRLRSVAKQVGALVRGMAPKGVFQDLSKLTGALESYSELLVPWANSVASYMLADVARKDAKMWRQHSKEVGRALSSEIASAPTGETLRQLQQQQVSLIKSIPLEAAQRVHRLSMSSLVSGVRAEELSKDILATESVTVARARLIARTEVARAAANLVEARASYAGSDGYIWRTSGDSDVRDSHKEMEGKYVRWAQPPILDKMTGHAGTLPNCRCFAEPVFPDA